LTLESGYYYNVISTYAKVINNRIFKVKLLQIREEISEHKKNMIF